MDQVVDQAADAAVSVKKEYVDLPVHARHLVKNASFELITDTLALHPGDDILIYQTIEGYQALMEAHPDRTYSAFHLGMVDARTQTPIKVKVRKIRQISEDPNDVCLSFMGMAGEFHIEDKQIWRCIE